MLALWSRATRAPGTCRCIACTPRNSVLATRTGLRLLGAPTSTFVYTAVFTAGLAIDAKAKQKRNEQWNIAFEQLRDEMGQSVLGENEEHSAATDIDPVEEALPSGIDVNAVHRIAGMDLVEQEMTEQLQSGTDIEPELETFWDYLPFDNRFPGGPNQNLAWPANTGPELIKHHLPPQSLWSLEHMRWTAIRKRQIWKKLAMQELAVGELIHALLAQASVSRIIEKDLALLSPVIRNITLLDPKENLGARHHIRECRERLAMVHKAASPEEIENIKSQIKGVGVPAYHQDRDGDFYDITRQMNTAIQKLLKEFPQGHGKYNDSYISLILAKLCHNLLISSAAPDLQTFNLLLAGFKRNKQPELVSHVIKAFRNCKIRPNEITCAIILDHYTETNDPDSFSKWVARMRGAGAAIMLAKPNIEINEMGQRRLVRVSEDKVYQKVHPTPLLFNSIMLGVLKFAGFDRAADIYFEMKEDGWGLDTLGLSHFLSDCVQRGDWNGGVTIWEEISSITQPVKHSHMAKAFSDMLSLCSVTGNTVAFNHFLNEVVRRGFDRQRIMRSVMDAERRVRGPERSSLAPAWTADNLLIAVSDFMEIDHQEEQESNAPPSLSQLNEDPRADQPTAPHDGSEVAEPSDNALEQLASTEQPSPPAINEDEAWAKWLQHELGEPPPDQTMPAPGDDLSAPRIERKASTKK